MFAKLAEKNLKRIIALSLMTISVIFFVLQFNFGLAAPSLLPPFGNPDFPAQVPGPQGQAGTQGPVGPVGPAGALGNSTPACIINANQSDSGPNGTACTNCASAVQVNAPRKVTGYDCASPEDNYNFVDTSLNCANGNCQLNCNCTSPKNAGLQSHCVARVWSCL